MKSTFFQQALIAVITLVCVVSSGIVTAAPMPQQSAATGANDGLVFDWNKAPWQGVIEWFAAEAGLNLEEVDQYPEGTFSLTSSRPYSPVEAIDELNHKLRLSDPPMTLLRNGRRLYLVNASRALPAELVETIDVSALDRRGKYEPLQVVFDVTGLELGDIQDQVQQRVQPYNKPFFQAYEDTSEIFVRESGENLRFIRDIITRAKAAGTPQWSEMILKHISAELFLQQVKGVYNLDENYSNPEGTLKMLIDSSAGAQRIIIRGTPAMLTDVKSAAKMIDKQPASAVVSEDDPFVLEIYSVPRDSKETFQVVDRLLFNEGGGALVQQGSETGKITVMGRKNDHQIVRDYFELLSANGGGGIRTIQLKNGDAAEILLASQTILGITPENVADNVSMLANSVRDFIIVRGTPSQVSEAIQVIEEIDRNSAPLAEGLRTNRRVIPMAPGDRDRILGSLEEYLPTLGRENKFELRPPANTEEDNDSLFRRRERELKGGGQSSFLRSTVFEFAVCLNPSLAMRLSSSLLQVPFAADDQANDGSAYVPPKQVKSVPGAPVRIWGTEFGIVVESDDLDAGDDVAYLIDSQIGEDSADAKPTVYQLKHCKASYMKQLLDSMYGLESSSGGGEGGGLLGGIADNVIGEAGGGVVDSLFGGGLGVGADSTSSFEGDVTLGVDSRLNYLWAIGATENDLALIDESVKMFDVSTPPQNPETAGQIYDIAVQHRDVEEMKMQVETLMEVYFRDTNARSGEGGGGGSDAANVVKMVRQATGGGGGGGGGANAVEEVKPRGYLSVDRKTSKLLFLGPKSIFVQVEALVFALDQPEVESPRIMRQIEVEGDASRIAELLKEVLGSDKVELAGAAAAAVNGDAADGSGTKEDAASGSSSKEAAAAKKAESDAKKAQEAQQRATANAQRNLFNQLRNRGGGGGGNRGGGNNRGGGGGNRGGNRGGR